MELGSGLGFSGLVVWTQCQPASVTLTDCHQAVLSLLAHNVNLNLTKYLRGLLGYTKQTDNPSSTKRFQEKASHCCNGETVRVSMETIHKEAWDRWTEECHGNVTCWHHHAQSDVQIAQLDWEDIADDDLRRLADRVDIIIAAGKPTMSTKCLYFRFLL